MLLLALTAARPPVRLTESGNPRSWQFLALQQLLSDDQHRGNFVGAGLGKPDVNSAAKNLNSGPPRTRYLRVDRRLYGDRLMGWARHPHTSVGDQVPVRRRR